MKIRVRWHGKNGLEFSGSSHDEIIKQMRDNPALPQFQQKSNWAYMAGVSSRASTFYGVEIPYYRSADFLRALAKAGIIELEEEI